MRPLKIILYKGKGAQPYRWRFRMPNGQVVAGPQEGYRTAFGARRAVMKLGEAIARGVVVEDTILPAPLASVPPAPPKAALTWAEAAAKSYTTIRGWIVKNTLA